MDLSQVICFVFINSIKSREEEIHSQATDTAHTYLYIDKNMFIDTPSVLTHTGI